MWDVAVATHVAPTDELGSRAARIPLACRCAFHSFVGATSVTTGISGTGRRFRHQRGPRHHTCRSGFSRDRGRGACLMARCSRLKPLLQGWSAFL